jgi:hypothetical protein
MQVSKNLLKPSTLLGGLFEPLGEGFVLGLDDDLILVDTEEAHVHMVLQVLGVVALFANIAPSFGLILHDLPRVTPPINDLCEFAHIKGARAVEGDDGNIVEADLEELVKDDGGRHLAGPEDHPHLARRCLVLGQPGQVGSAAHGHDGNEWIGIVQLVQFGYQDMAIAPTTQRGFLDEDGVQHTLVHERLQVFHDRLGPSLALLQLDDVVGHGIKAPEGGWAPSS